LEKAGRLQFNCTGTEFTWPVKKAEIPATEYVTGTVTYTAHALHDQATVGRRGYIATDQIHKYDAKMNSGTEALVNLWKNKAVECANGIKNKIHTGIYQNGDGSDGFEGFGTWCAEAGTVANNDRILQPVDTYGTLATTLGQGGSTWSTDLSASTVPIIPNAALAYDWPFGQGDPEFDFWSPIIARYGGTSAAGWTGSADTWTTTCELVLSQVYQWLTIMRDFGGPPDSCVMSPEMLSGLKSALRADRHYYVEDTSDNADFGLGPTINYEGLKCWTEYGVPAGCGYIYRTEDIDLLCLESELITKEGPFFDENNMMYKFLATCPGNMRIKSPRRFAKLMSHASG